MWWCPQLHVDIPGYVNPFRGQLCQTLGGIDLTVTIDDSIKKIPKTRWKDGCQLDLKSAWLRAREETDRAMWRMKIISHTGDPTWWEKYWTEGGGVDRAMRRMKIISHTGDPRWHDKYLAESARARGDGHGDAEKKIVSHTGDSTWGESHGKEEEEINLVQSRRQNNL